MKDKFVLPWWSRVNLNRTKNNFISFFEMFFSCRVSSLNHPPPLFRSLGDEEIIHVTKYVQGIVHTPFPCRTSFPLSLAHLKSQWILQYVKKIYKTTHRVGLIDSIIFSKRFPCSVSFLFSPF
jgi:hypothetical protein